MCGISGQVGQPSTLKVQMEALKTMVHRGPDAEGGWQSPQGDVWLGHCRLAILDLSDAGRQPMQNEDGSIFLVCNGEIYNHPILRRDLEKRGHHYSSNSDSETILHAYEEWGDDCVMRFEGMFAFALWDESRRRLLIARDPVGIKPLYYAPLKNGLAFGSEAQVVSGMTLRRNIEPLALGYILTLGYVPAPFCIWKGIQKLEAGHLLTWNLQSGMKIKRYWNPPTESDPDCQPTPDRWQSLWSGVVEDHLLSDVPLGLFLSGGLDSSALALALHDLKQDVEGITISFPATDRDESAIARELCEKLHMRQSITPLVVGDVEQLASKVAAVYDEPQGYSALLSMYRVSEIAAKKYKVILAGDGGDEVFGGYKWYPKQKKKRAWWKLPKRINPKSRAGSSATNDPWKEFSNQSVLHAHAARVFPRFFPHEVEALFQPLGLKFSEEEMLAPLHKHFVETLPLKRALQRVDLMTFCTDSILAKVDRASMAHSLEVRVPFLDRRIVEWGLRLPLQQEENRISKQVLRRYLQDRVPESTLNHPKQGFSVGVLNGIGASQVTERIDASAWVRNGFCRSDWKNVTDPAKPYHQARMWTLYQLAAWSEFHLPSS